MAATLLMWAAAFVAVRHVEGHFSPGAPTWGRLAVASAAWPPSRWLVGRPRPTRGGRGRIAVIGTATSTDERLDEVGILLCLAAAAASAISMVLQKAVFARMPAVQITWLACTVGAPGCLPFAPQLSAEPAAAPATSLMWLIYLGALPTAVAFTTYAFALRSVNASTLGLTTYSIPAITVLLGIVFLSEDPPR